MTQFRVYMPDLTVLLAVLVAALLLTAPARAGEPVIASGDMALGAFNSDGGIEAAAPANLYHFAKPDGIGRFTD